MNTTLTPIGRGAWLLGLVDAATMVLLVLAGLFLSACDAVDANRADAEALLESAVDSAAAAGVAPVPASIGPVNVEAHVYADQPLTPFYIGTNAGTSSSGNGNTEIRRLRTGTYEVRFLRLAAKIQGDAHAQSVAVSAGNHQCASSAPVKSGQDVVLNVSCVRMGDFQNFAPADAAFSAFVVDEDDDLAFATNEAGFTNRTVRTHNAWGRTVGITETSPGVFRGFFGLEDGPLADGGNVHVSGIGCSLASWNPKANGGTQLAFEVQCFDAFGRRARRTFQVLATSRTHLGAYAWAHQPSTPTAYAPHPNHSFNPSAGRIAVRQLSTGVYRVAFEDVHTVLRNLPTVKVTRHGGDEPVHCSVAGDWRYGTAGRLEVSVQCQHQQTGAPTDSRFTLMALAFPP